MRGIYAYRPFSGDRHPVGMETRAPQILAAWLRRHPDSQPDPKADPEDWIENATVLHTAEEIGIDLTILPNGNRVHVTGAGWHGPVAQQGAPIGAMFGYWSNSDFMTGLPIAIDVVGSDERSVRAAGNYASSETFRRHAGRPMALANGDVDGERGIERALRTVVEAAGSGEIFIKTVQKEWAAPFTVDPSSEVGLWRQLEREDMRIEEETDGAKGYGLAWIPVTHEGSLSPILLIQGRIRPTYEYRIVVIDGRPVTASGCIEAFTPAENLSDAFDPQMEEVRSDGKVVLRPDLMARYLAFAEAFCTEFAAEHGEGLDYGLDLCVDAITGDIVPIEINPPLGLGAYARSTNAWMSAIVERTERLAAAR